MAKLTAAACRAARGILKWSLRDLEVESGVSLKTLNKFERSLVKTKAETKTRIKDAFLRHNVEIINTTGTGVRLLHDEKS